MDHSMAIDVLLCPSQNSGLSIGLYSAAGGGWLVDLSVMKRRI